MKYLLVILVMPWAFLWCGILCLAEECRMYMKTPFPQAFDHLRVIAVFLAVMIAVAVVAIVLPVMWLSQYTRPVIEWAWRLIQ